MSNYDFRLPDIGEGLHEAEILSWFVAEGDRVNEHDNIAEVQTDKAAVEITSPVTGTVASLGAEAGETMRVGDVLVSFTDIENNMNQTESPNNRAEVGEKNKDSNKDDTLDDVVPIENRQHPANRVLAAPSVRKAARELNVNLSDINGTGPNGRVLRKDLEVFISQEKPMKHLTSETSEKLASEPTRIEDITDLRKVIFHNMQHTTSTAALCTGMDEVNVSKLVEFRKNLLSYTDGLGIKLTYLPFIIKAVSLALKKFPIFNAHIDDENMKLIYHNDVHIGIATATEEGLIVPVIRHADKMSVIELAESISNLAQKARDKKLSPTDLTGSTFTISSTGPSGGQFATPIINYPELAILGVHQIKKMPVVVDDELEIGHMMGMSLTFDHRIIDGQPSGLFMNELAQFLNKPERLLIHL